MYFGGCIGRVSFSINMFPKMYQPPTWLVEILLWNCLLSIHHIYSLAQVQFQMFLFIFLSDAIFTLHYLYCICFFSSFCIPATLILSISSQLFSRCMAFYHHCLCFMEFLLLFHATFFSFEPGALWTLEYFSPSSCQELVPILSLF